MTCQKMQLSLDRQCIIKSFQDFFHDLQLQNCKNSLEIQSFFCSTEQNKKIRLCNWTSNEYFLERLIFWIMLNEEIVLVLHWNSLVEFNEQYTIFCLKNAKSEKYFKIGCIALIWFFFLLIRASILLLHHCLESLNYSVLN